jgi:arginase
LHWPAIARPGGRRLFDPADVVHLGCRDNDEHLTEARATLPLVVTAGEAKAQSGEPRTP